MSKPADPKLIGAFVLGAIALIVAGVVVLGGGKFFEKTTPVVMYFQGSVAGLATGSPVNFRGVKVGQVTNVFIRFDPEAKVPVQIPVYAEFSSQNVQMVGDHGGRQMHGATDERLKQLVEQGLRAQLALPSLVTGQTTVTLDFFPGTPVEYEISDPDTGRVQIPTIPSTLQEVQATLQQLYNKLSQLPLDELIDDARNVMSGAAKLVNNPDIPQAIGSARQTMADLQVAAKALDSRIGPLIAGVQTTTDAATRTMQDAQRAMGQLNASGERLIAATDKTMQAADRLLSNANTWVAPGSQVNYEVLSALRETAAAARSLRDLAEQIQRSPNSLLIGRQPAGASR